MTPQPAKINCCLTGMFCLFISLSLMCVGCSSQSVYSLGVANDGTNYITEAKITYGSRTLQFGNLVAKSSASDYPVALPIPESATVIWTQQSGAQFQKTVEIRKLVQNPKKFEGWIWVRLYDDGTAKAEVEEAK